jgi:hypothetical protein
MTAALRQNRARDGGAGAGRRTDAGQKALPGIVSTLIAAPGE